MAKLKIVHDLNRTKEEYSHKLQGIPRDIFTIIFYPYLVLAIIFSIIVNLWQRILALIPGTLPFFYRVSREAIVFSRRGLETFQSLRTISDATRQTLTFCGPYVAALSKART